MTTLVFHGAAREVTGSMHVVEAGGRRVALDCGMFQGRRAEAAEKNVKFPFDPRELDAVILSHAHIDHSGRLPLLARQGYEGPVYSTPATRDLCAIMLADSAYIQEEDARYLNKKRLRRGEAPLEPLYNVDDAHSVLRLFHSVSFGRPFAVTDGVRGEFFETGHMLGAAGVLLTIRTGNGRPLRIVFTGDLGRFGMPILRDPSPLPHCDYLICESTYGGRATPGPRDLPGQLEKVLHETIERGGKVIVPAFSVGRTQTVVYTLHQLMHEERIPRIPVYIDSPLSVNATEIFRLHPECYNADARAFLRETGDILGNGCCTYVRSVEQSKSLNKKRKPCVIVSASGMCETGRILHHLKNNVQSAKNTVLIVGFQAANTLGRRIVEREPTLSILNQKLRLRAQVVVLNGFSAHADRDELRRMTQPLARDCRGAFLVHGEPDQMQQMSDSMRAVGFRSVETPEPGQRYELADAK
jgi:metallo-beta-lactamase family protein